MGLRIALAHETDVDETKKASRDRRLVLEPDRNSWREMFMQPVYILCMRVLPALLMLGTTWGGAQNLRSSRRWQRAHQSLALGLPILVLTIEVPTCGVMGVIYALGSGFSSDILSQPMQLFFPHSLAYLLDLSYCPYCSDIYRQP